MSSSICKGFQVAGIAAGIKKNGGKDLGLIFSEVPANAAGMLTRNKVKAAPVILDETRLKSGIARAVIVNSGNANCCTGTQGDHDAEAMAHYAAASLGISDEHVLVASTGVIGEPLPLEKIESAVPDLLKSLNPNGFDDFAAAIMTTDTVPKLATRTISIEGKSFTITAVAKGAGMIRPDMATMLCFICTDAGISSRTLDSTLRSAVDKSFNRISIDGDTSTNDTVLILANGMSGATVDDKVAIRLFQSVLDEMLIDLAKQLIRDGEGVTKLVEIIIKNAASNNDAFKIADAIAHSPLVKTAFFGEDANWGRILGAAGRSGAQVDPHRIDLFFDGVQMVEDGKGCGKTAEAEVTCVLRKNEFAVTLDLHLGDSSCSLLTCDLSLDYVRINADYRS